MQSAPHAGTSCRCGWHGLTPQQNNKTTISKRVPDPKLRAPLKFAREDRRVQPPGPWPSPRPLAKSKVGFPIFACNNTKRKCYLNGSDIGATKTHKRYTLLIGQCDNFNFGPHKRCTLVIGQRDKRQFETHQRCTLRIGQRGKCNFEARDGKTTMLQTNIYTYICIYI